MSTLDRKELFIPLLTSPNEEKMEETQRRKIEELNSDISVLKRLVYILNVELELRDSGYKENCKDQQITSTEAVENLLRKPDIKMIKPLLQAFDETKKEKDILLCNYKQSFDDMTNRCKTIVIENDSLRHQLQEAKIKAESSLVEWQKLHEKFQLTEEHNRLLTRQSKLLQNKINELEEVHGKTVKQFEEDKKDLWDNFENIKSELLFFKGRFSVYSDHDLSKDFPIESKNDHLITTILSDLKKLSLDVKTNHTNEIKLLRNKINALESEKCDINIKLISLSSERDHLQGYISALETETKRTESDSTKIREELEEVRKNEESAKKQIFKCMAFIRELVSIHQKVLNENRLNEARNGL